MVIFEAIDNVFDRIVRALIRLDADHRIAKADPRAKENGQHNQQHNKASERAFWKFRMYSGSGEKPRLWFWRMYALAFFRLLHGHEPHSRCRNLREPLQRS